jgi:hypothetical protein
MRLVGSRCQRRVANGEKARIFLLWYLLMPGAIFSPKSSINSEPSIEEDVPLYYPFFSKADIADERWNVCISQLSFIRATAHVPTLQESSGKGKEKIAWPFVDPNDALYLPPSLVEVDHTHCTRGTRASEWHTCSKTWRANARMSCSTRTPPFRS